MGYGTPMENQNKGYAAQEKKDLLKDNPVAKVASGGSWMSKHISSPLAMGKGSGMYMKDMAPKMESDTPAKMHGALHMDKGAPAMMKGDLDKDGKMSSYESKRQAAIEKNMKK